MSREEDVDPLERLVVSLTELDLPQKLAVHSCQVASTFVAVPRL